MMFIKGLGLSQNFQFSSVLGHPVDIQRQLVMKQMMIRVVDKMIYRKTFKSMILPNVLSRLTPLDTIKGPLF